MRERDWTMIGNNFSQLEWNSECDFVPDAKTNHAVLVVEVSDAIIGENRSKY